MFGDKLKNRWQEHRLDGQIRRVGLRALSSSNPELLFLSQKVDTETVITKLADTAPGIKVLCRTPTGEILIGRSTNTSTELPHSSDIF